MKLRFPYEFQAYSDRIKLRWGHPEATTWMRCRRGWSRSQYCFHSHTVAGQTKRSHHPALQWLTVISISSHGAPSSLSWQCLLLMTIVALSNDRSDSFSSFLVREASFYIQPRKVASIYIFHTLILRASLIYRVRIESLRNGRYSKAGLCRQGLLLIFSQPLGTRLTLSP